MSHPVTHPSSNTIIDRVAQAFHKGRVYKTHNHKLMFVCGGPAGDKDNSLRKKFIEYADDNLPEFRVFQSERAARDLTRSRKPQFLNLAKFEELLGAVADCILLFIESPGSMAELGYFSNAKSAIKHLLIVNDLRYQTQESFINNGPVSLIDQRSAFRPAIHLNSNNLPNDFKGIRERLSRFDKTYRERFSFNEPLGAQDRLFLILEIIKLFRVIDVHGILHVLERVHHKCNEEEEEEARRLVSILLATNYVRRLEGNSHMLAVSPDVQTFLDLEKFPSSEFQLTLSEHYMKLSPEIYDLLEEASA